MEKIKKNLLVIYTILCSLIIAVGTIIAPFFIIAVVNELYTNKIASDMQRAPLPPQTELIDMLSFCGNPRGTSSHCSAWVALLVKSDLSEEELEIYYRTLYKEGKPQYNPVQVSALSAERPTKFSFMMHSKEFQCIASIENFEQYYVVERMLAREGIWGLLE